MQDDPNSNSNSDPNANPDFRRATGFWVFAALHMLCCGLPLALAAGFSFEFIRPLYPVLGIGLAVLGVVGFIWYCARGCATCPRNEKRILHRMPPLPPKQ